MPETPTLVAQVAALSKEERAKRLEVLLRGKAESEGEIAVHLGEVDRNQAYRDDGATSTESWAMERFGVSTATARALTHVGEKVWDIPHLESLCAGDLSFDKVRAVADVAAPETDRQLRDQAKRHSVRELADIARSTTKPTAAAGRSDHDRRFLRFNDQFRTMTVQLPPASYAETQACIEARTRKVPSDGETPLDERRCDALMEVIRSATPGRSGRATTASPYFVVAHVLLDALVEEQANPLTSPVSWNVTADRLRDRAADRL
jgi:hypothetical protein